MNLLNELKEIQWTKKQIIFMIIGFIITANFLLYRNDDSHAQNISQAQVQEEQVESEISKEELEQFKVEYVNAIGSWVMNNLAITNSYEAYKNCEKGKDKMFQFIDEIEQSKLDKKTKENMKKLCTTAHIYFGTYQKFLDNSTNKNKMQFEQDFAWVNSELQNNGFDPATYQN